VYYFKLNYSPKDAVFVFLPAQLLADLLAQHPFFLAEAVIADTSALPFETTSF